MASPPPSVGTSRLSFSSTSSFGGSSIGGSSSHSRTVSFCSTADTEVSVLTPPSSPEPGPSRQPLKPFDTKGSSGDVYTIQRSETSVTRGKRAVRLRSRAVSDAVPGPFARLDISTAADDGYEGDYGGNQGDEGEDSPSPVVEFNPRYPAFNIRPQVQSTRTPPRSSPPQSERTSTSSSPSTRPTHTRTPSSPGSLNKRPGAPTSIDLSSIPTFASSFGGPDPHRPHLSIADPPTSPGGRLLDASCRHDVTPRATTPMPTHCFVLNPSRTTDGIFLKAPTLVSRFSSDSSMTSEEECGTSPDVERRREDLIARIPDTRGDEDDVCGTEKVITVEKDCPSPRPGTDKVLSSSREPPPAPGATRTLRQEVQESGSKNHSRHLSPLPSPRFRSISAPSRPGNSNSNPNLPPTLPMRTRDPSRPDTNRPNNPGLPNLSIPSIPKRLNRTSIPTPLRLALDSTRDRDRQQSPSPTSSDRSASSSSSSSRSPKSRPTSRASKFERPAFLLPTPPGSDGGRRPSEPHVLTPFVELGSKSNPKPAPAPGDHTSGKEDVVHSQTSVRRSVGVEVNPYFPPLPRTG